MIVAAANADSIIPRIFIVGLSLYKGEKVEKVRENEEQVNGIAREEPSERMMGNLSLLKLKTSVLKGLNGIEFKKRHREQRSREIIYGKAAKHKPYFRTYQDQ